MDSVAVAADAAAAGRQLEALASDMERSEVKKTRVVAIKGMNLKEKKIALLLSSSGV